MLKKIKRKVNFKKYMFDSWLEKSHRFYFKTLQFFAGAVDPGILVEVVYGAVNLAVGMERGICAGVSGVASRVSLVRKVASIAWDMIIWSTLEATEKKNC